MTPLILSFPGPQVLSHRLAEAASIPLGTIDTRTFPDGETYLRIGTDCSGASVVLVCSLDRPDPKILPLLFLADAARSLGAVRVGLVAPYLAYMRQDRRFQRGEAVTSRTFARLLCSAFDWLVTVDPHLHRYQSLTDLYDIPNRVVNAAPALATWIGAHVQAPLIVGPDEESLQWASAVAEGAKAPVFVMRKVRHGDRDVEISLPATFNVDTYKGRTPVIVDDVASSAHTMIETVKQLVGAGTTPPICLVVHGLFSAEGEHAVRAAGAAAIVTTTSVEHPTNQIDVVPLLVPAVRDFVAGAL